MTMNIKYIIDIDKTICDGTRPARNCKPFQNVINKINLLYPDNKITLFTSRFKSDRKITMEWLKKYKVKYHKLIMGKPNGDVYVDDKNISIKEFLR